MNLVTNNPGRKSVKKYFILLSSLCVLGACTGAHEDLHSWVENAQKEAKSHIIPFKAPTIDPPQTYIAPDFTGLNAFDSKRLNAGLQGTNAPNLKRPKEFLESFSLENLKYVGSLHRGNNVFGYVEVEGHTYTVRPGNYMGQNFGRIKSITTDKINLVEVVEDSYGNWIFRDAELPISTGVSNTDNGNSQNDK